ncbi:hypothetical protein RD792_017722 [Penstemon davidsonii]|uniref:Peptidase A1 domain-containing protein n=1 Tax=Penstemon davidsonii TaxID=160366 RepID=A0ABR0DWC7_9LAMI|nr:hypothetical protein RD792_017722 [Penstemon davidsonii]
MNHRLNFLAYVTIISFLAMSMGLEIETNNKTTGFTLDLIHIDSPQSPFYDPTLSSSQRMEKVLQRSLDRIHHFKTWIKFGDPPQTDIVSFASGQYLIKYSIGTPPISSFAIADTGSNVIWLQCQPCLKCFPQNLPIFNPKSSSTYSMVPCISIACRSFGRTICTKNKISCLYQVSYEDGSYTKGVISRDTVTLPTPHGHSWSFPFIKFGCGHDNGGIFRAEETGIVGLGRGETSLIGQMDFVIQGKFSYCLVSLYYEPLYTSKMNFGANAIVSGPGTVSTPLDTSKSPSTFYYLTLDGVSIDGQRLEFYDYSSNNSKFVEDGNILIDTGTIITYLPQGFYERIKEIVKRLIHFRQVSDKLFDLCYFLRTEIIIFPFMTFHFKGADVKLRAENIFIRVSDTTICLGILPTKFNEDAIFGNAAQRDFLVGFDLKKGTVSFKPTVCGRYS